MLKIEIDWNDCQEILHVVQHSCQDMKKNIFVSCLHHSAKGSEI